MTDTSSVTAALHDDEAQPSDTIMATTSEDAATTAPAWLSLPPEIWERIVSFLLPLISPEQAVFPRPDCKSFEDPIAPMPQYRTDLPNLALTNQHLNELALRALFRAPFLPTVERVNKFVENMCHNDRGVLVPETSRSAGWIRSLQIKGEISESSYFAKPKSFCTCDVHLLLSLAPHIQYLSLHCSDGRNDYFEEEHIEDHLMAHFLSSTTQCRPRWLRWRQETYGIPLSLKKVTSYAPLSQLTHLELIGTSPSQEFIAFLLGAFHLAPEAPEVEAAISAGLSPSSKLECVRLSHAPTEPLNDFEEFAAWRARPTTSYRFEEAGDFEFALYDMAVNASGLPNLRLLILDAEFRRTQLPIDLLKRLVLKGVLQDVSQEYAPSPEKSPKFATSSLSCLFATKKRKSSLDTSVTAGSLEVSLTETESDWYERFRSADEYWQQIHKGKHDLIRLWN